MTKINDGGPAFPMPEWQDAHGTIIPAEYGMSLRDYFAIHADVSGTQFPTIQAMADFIGVDLPNNPDFSFLMQVAAMAHAKIKYAVADAMLKAREVQP
ncbi:MAG: hypothetical protein RL492_1764 [Verrucomicrobiota bacterium]